MPMAPGPPVFAYYTSNYPATPNANQPPSTTYTAGASSADGTAVTCLSALGHDVHLVKLHLWGNSSTGVDMNTAGDLLIDPAGGTAWVSLVEDLVCGATKTSAISSSPTSYEFPLWIPAGASVGWRAKNVRAATTAGCMVLVQVYGEPSRPEMWWCGQGVETLGIADAKGTAITPGNSGAAGAWTSVGSPTTRHIKAVQLGVNTSDDTALSAYYHFSLGAGSQLLPGTGLVWKGLATDESGSSLGTGLQYCNVPVGTQMQARATCNTTAEVLYAAIYGVY